MRAAGPLHAPFRRWVAAYAAPTNRPLVTSMIRPLRRGLHEFKRHPVALADREVLVLVLVLERERRRQGPDALRMILGVLGVCVDLALCLERESRVGREL